MSSREWIRGPWTDLGLFAFSWLPFYAACVLSPWLTHRPLCDVGGSMSCGPFVTALILLCGYASRLHRHYTLGLVYGDPGEFARRPGLYTWLPIASLVALAPFALNALFARGPRHFFFNGLMVLSGISGAYTIYHAILQKYGILRIYSARLGYGDARVERGMLLSSGLLVAAWLAGRAAPMAAREAYLWYGVDIRILQPAMRLAPYLCLPVLPLAAHYWWRFIALERRHGTRESIPRWLFTAASVLMLLSFGHSLVAGYVGAQINHAIEYVAFVHVFAPRRPGLARWTRRPVVSNLLVVGVVVGLSWLLSLNHRLAAGLLLGYIVHNSILHFVYDSVLWRVRELVPNASTPRPS